MKTRASQKKTMTDLATAAMDQYRSMWLPPTWKQGLDILAEQVTYTHGDVHWACKSATILDMLHLGTMMPQIPHVIAGYMIAKHDWQERDAEMLALISSVVEQIRWNAVPLQGVSHDQLMSDLKDVDYR